MQEFLRYTGCQPDFITGTKKIGQGNEVCLMLQAFLSRHSPGCSTSGFMQVVPKNLCLVCVAAVKGV